MFLRNQSELQKIFIYTDASFNRSLGLAVAGYLYFDSESLNAKGEVTQSNIETFTVEVKNNIRAEIMGVNCILQKLSYEIQLKRIDINKLEINLYSDCQTLTHLLRRRDKLTTKKFISDRKKTELANADLYKEFYAIYDLLKPKIYWLKGHSRAEGQSLEQRNFQIIDQKVRRELRRLVAAQIVR